MDGDRLVLGASDDDTGGQDSGVVKIFSATTGLLQMTLVNPSPSFADTFGYSVALSGDRLVVGSPGDSAGASFTGCVHVYNLGGATPSVPVLTITNPNPTANDSFGLSLALSGNRLVVGAYLDDEGATDAGRAYVYDLSSGTPSTPVVTINNPAADASDQFGYAVAVDGSIVVVSARSDDTGAANAGSAYVYDVTSGTPGTPVQTLNNPTPADGDAFGVSVAVSGSRVVVGATGDSTLVAAAGSAYLYDLTSGTPTVPVHTIPNAQPNPNEAFGSSLSLAGARLIVGAFVDGTGASAAGSAYLYDLAGGTPTVPVRTFNNPAPVIQDRFGTAVAQSGDRILITAANDDLGAINSGTGYFYDLTSPTPVVPVHVLNHPGVAVDNHFGSSVAVSGSLMAVGAPDDDLTYIGTGSVTVYDLNSATPTVPVLFIPSPQPASSIVFGCAVALEGTRLVVGARGESTGAPFAGSVYVFDLIGATPTVPVLTLNNPMPGSGDDFGVSVALSGSRVVVGARSDDTVASNAGSAYVYDLAGATPTTPILTLNQTPADDQFGTSVGISGTSVIVSAHNNDTGGANSGVVYVYDLLSGTPSTPVQTLNNPTPASSDLFGYAVSISGTRAVVGAYSDNTGASDAGAAYVYDLAGATPNVPVHTLLNPSPANTDNFGVSLSLSGSRVVVGAPGDDTSASNAGIAYVYDLSGASPTTAVATLVNPSPTITDNFGNAVCIHGTRIAVGAPNSDLSASNQGAAHVFAPPSTDAGLAGLTMSTGTLSPSFDTATLNYSAVVPLSTGSITITPTKAHFGASITVNGMPVTSGSPSGSITLNPGSNPMSVVVTAQDGVSTQTYVIDTIVQGSGTMSFADSVYVVASSATGSVADIVLQRTSSTAGVITCELSSSDGTATAPAQYTAQSATPVSFANTEGTQHVLIPITAGATTTVAKVFTISLAAPSSGAFLGSLTTATVVILPPGSATDKVKPAVTIGAPAKNAVIVDTLPVTISGTATDNIGVSKVQVSLNNGLTYTDANLASLGGATTTYSVSLQPLPGVNSLKVRSLDFKGNVSALAAQTFTHLRTLTVGISGPALSGTVNAGFVPSSARQVGKSYSIVATPKAGFVFDGWTVSDMTGTGITAASAELPKLSFIMQASLSLTAKFIVDPFKTTVTGDFSGLVTPSGSLPAGGTVASHATTGLCIAKLTTKGSLTGNVKMDGLTLPFTAVCDNTGVARFGPTRATTIMLARPGKPGLTLALKADLTGATKQVTGTLSHVFRGDLVAESNITASRHAYDGKPASSVPASYVKLYTARLKARASQGAGFTSKDYPQGDGYLTFQIKANGTVTMTGKLADDTKVTATASLSQNNHWPIFQQLYMNKGCIAADAVLDETQADTDAKAMNVLWFRPFQVVQWYPYGWDDGILVDLLASKYTPPPASVFSGLGAVNPTVGNTDLTFTDGLLTSSITTFVNLTTDNKLTLALLGDKSFTFKPAFATGLISGTFTVTNTIKSAWQGVLMQKGANKGGHGYFMSAKPAALNYLGESGKVSWTAK